MKYNPTHIATYLSNKKKLLYLAVVAGTVFLIFIGVPIEQSITNGAEQEARMYQTALQTTSDEQLNYSIDTKQGRVLAPITVKPADLVKFPEMNKEFSAVYKEEETYSKHSRQVCTTDSKGHQQCRTEYYYSWDVTNSGVAEASGVEMAGRKYSYGLFALRSTSVNASEIIPGETGHYVVVENKGWFDIGWGNNVGDKRYSYRVVILPQSGTAFLNVTEGVQAVFGNRIELHNESPQELVKSSQNSAQTKSTVFTVLWVILVLCVLFGGGYAAFSYREY